MQILDGGRYRLTLRGASAVIDVDCTVRYSDDRNTLRLATLDGRDVSVPLTAVVGAAPLVEFDDHAAIAPPAQPAATDDTEIRQKADVTPDTKQHIGPAEALFLGQVRGYGSQLSSATLKSLADSLTVDPYLEDSLRAALVPAVQAMAVQYGASGADDTETLHAHAHELRDCCRLG